MSTFKGTDVTRLCCPKCSGGLKDAGAKGLTCNTCAAVYAVTDGIPQLLQDPSLFTHRESIDYVDHHNIDDASREKVANN